MEEQKPTEKDSLEETLSMEGYDKPVRNARIVLFIMAGIQLAYIFMIGDIPQPYKAINIGINISIAVAFTLLAFWTKTKPYTAIITALIVYSCLIVLGAILEPISILQGFIFKILTYVMLIVAIGNAKSVQRWKNLANK
jgi:hypothetical protein